MCVTLNEGYLRSANRGSNNYKIIQIFNQNITDQPPMKRLLFWSVFFTVFLETTDLQSYCGFFYSVQ